MARWHAVLATLMVAVALVILVSPLVASLSVSPTRHQLINPGEQTYQYVYSITNDGPAPQTITLKLERYSTYLADRVTFSKEQFALTPGQTENIQVSFSPSKLGPETHTVTVGAYEGETRLVLFELLAIVSGTPVENYAITIAVDDITASNLVPVEVTLKNLGNVIGYAKPKLEILDGTGAVIGAVSNPEAVQVVPGGEKTFILPFTEELKPGFYTARITAAFPSQSPTVEKQFSVALGETSQTIAYGEDLIISFASLGNPPRIQYALRRSDGSEVAAGSHEPTSGDLVIRTSELPSGSYSLDLVMRGQTQTRTVTIRDEAATLRLVLFVVVGVIVSIGLWSTRRIAFTQARLYRLRWMVARRERMVNNLINRAHRLVDEYAEHARRNSRDRSP